MMREVTMMIKVSLMFLLFLAEKKREKEKYGTWRIIGTRTSQLVD